MEIDYNKSSGPLQSGLC